MLTASKPYYGKSGLYDYCCTLYYREGECNCSEDEKYEYLDHPFVKMLYTYSFLVSSRQRYWNDAKKLSALKKDLNNELLYSPDIGIYKQFRESLLWNDCNNNIDA
jgi:hypothetical protein